MNESTKNAIENNVMMINSGIRLLTVGNLSTDVIETEFHTLQLLLDDCKRLAYNSLEN